MEYVKSRAKGFVIVLVVIFSSILLNGCNKLNGHEMSVGGKKLQVEIAGTEAEKAQGLSDRKNLCSNCGMLFIYDQKGIYPFWMRRMHFDIDIIWVNEGKVVDITFGAKVPPKEELEAPKTTYQSKVPVKMVLEVNSGWTKKNNVQIGTDFNLVK